MGGFLIACCHEGGSIVNGESPDDCCGKGGFLIRYKIFGPVAQLVRALPCHGRGQGFESLLGRLQTMYCL